ncbi:MAG: TMEM143 family protein, partial [Leptolyngbyaceae cyanobacterium]
MGQTQPQRENFIPLNRRDLVKLCLADDSFSATDAQHFRDFCEILSAYFHFQFHATLEAIKENYAPFNPNVDVQSQWSTQVEELVPMQEKFIHHFTHLLEKSNYLELSKGTLRRALEERSLIALHTDVNFNDFQTFSCYYRGDIHQEIETKTWLWRKTIRTIDIFERVVLLIQFKDESYFIDQKIDLDTLNYSPGKIYLYFYRDVPKYDLELLFPNVETSMTWKDRLMLIVPAIGAGIAIASRMLSQFFIILGAILVVLEVESSQRSTEQLQTNQVVLAALVATLSLAMALGGFAFKQYSTYKNKKIQFQKNVTDTLFFRSIANHSAVFQLLIDVAEEEECKEVILAYFHLLQSEHPLSSQELDQTVEEWITQR